MRVLGRGHRDLSMPRIIWAFKAANSASALNQPTNTMHTHTSESGEVTRRLANMCNVVLGLGCDGLCWRLYQSFGPHRAQLCIGKGKLRQLCLCNAENLHVRVGHDGALGKAVGSVGQHRERGAVSTRVHERSSPTLLRPSGTHVSSGDTRHCSPKMAGGNREAM